MTESAHALHPFFSAFITNDPWVLKLTFRPRELFESMDIFTESYDQVIGSVQEGSPCIIYPAVSWSRQSSPGPSSLIVSHPVTNLGQNNRDSIASGSRSWVMLVTSGAKAVFISQFIGTSNVVAEETLNADAPEEQAAPVVSTLRKFPVTKPLADMPLPRAAMPRAGAGESRYQLAKRGSIG